MSAEMLRLLRLPEVLATVGLGRSAWYALVAAGHAPQPVHLGKAVAWVSSEIAAFVQERIAERSTAEAEIARKAKAVRMAEIAHEAKVTHKAEVARMARKARTP